MPASKDRFANVIRPLLLFLRKSQKALGSGGEAVLPDAEYLAAWRIFYRDRHQIGSMTSAGQRHDACGQRSPNDAFQPFNMVDFKTHVAGDARLTKRVISLTPRTGTGVEVHQRHLGEFVECDSRT